MNRPQIKTELPGPKAKEIIERDAKVMSTSLSRDVPLVVERTQDVWIYDVDGNEFLDMTSGVGVTNVGHTNPKVVEAIKNQVEKFLHFAGTDFYYEPQVTLAESLNDIRPLKNRTGVLHQQRHRVCGSLHKAGEVQNAAPTLYWVLRWFPWKKHGIFVLYFFKSHSA